MVKGKGSKGPKIRLFLAVVIVSFCFFGMHPSIFEDNICKAITTQELYPVGFIRITNLSPYHVTINFSGAQTFSEMIRPEYQMVSVAREGSYAYIAYFTFAPYRPIRGFTEVVEDKTSNVTIKTGKKK